MAPQQFRNPASEASQTGGRADGDLRRSGRRLPVLITCLLLAATGCEKSEEWTLAPAIAYAKHQDSTDQAVPILSEGPRGFDAGEVDSPIVVFDRARSRTGTGDPYLLYYEATGADGNTSIGVVTSAFADFRSRVVERVCVIEQGHPGAGSDVMATDPSVLVDPRGGSSSSDRYKMWFEGKDRSEKQAHTIHYCVSEDGVEWSTAIPCRGLDVVNGRVADPTVILDGDVYRMWFEMSLDDGGTGIGYAESANGIDWTITDSAGARGRAADAVFEPNGKPGLFDSFSVGSPSVAMDSTIPWGVDGRYLLWYEAGDKPRDVVNSIGFASSPDGLRWTRHTIPVLSPSSHRPAVLAFDSGDLEHPAALIDPSIPMELDGHFLLWYTGGSEESGQPNRIGLAKGRTEFGW